ncbi:coiled coil domain containing protein 130 [Echinococcus multilocularis]|uniref:Coiled coil domain containing protein 130 n=1 Tax=Echinococcus multilocularis TaxID=6211 RepID=A0A068YBE6_ECHMU|nr:coiled coil domain containing protein 130 [Echinococcus multilocularis]
MRPAGVEANASHHFPPPPHVLRGCSGRITEGERKGTNKYYPPDFDPAKHRNLNAYHGVHALRERGRKADKGIIIIRFEMPYNAWCLSCKKPIGMGVRYNAEKKKVGMHHSTPIFQFSMNCAMCAGRIVMQTDPQNFDYVCVEGIRRKIQTWDPKENEQIAVPDFKERQKLSLDAMYQVEHGVKDKEKAALSNPVLFELESDRESFKDDFALNYLARKQFREAKKLQNDADTRDEALKSRLSLMGTQITILRETDEDRTKAKLMRLHHTGHSDRTAGSQTPLIKIGKSFRLKRKQENSCEPPLTQQPSEPHWLAKRASTFAVSATQACSSSTSREPLSRALQKSIRKNTTKTDETPSKEITDNGQTSSSLVPYNDSE